MPRRLTLLIILLGWTIFVSLILMEYLQHGLEFLRHIFYPGNIKEYIFIIQIATIPLAFSVVGKIVYDRLKLAEKIRQTENKYLQLYQNAPIGYHSITEDTTIREVNDTWLKMFGYERQEIEGKVKLLDLVPVYHQDFFATNFARLKKEGRLQDIRYDIRKKDGNYLPVVIDTFSIYDENGVFSHTFTAVKDNSAQVVYEEMLKKSTQQWENTFDNMPNSAILLDNEARVIKINKPLLAILGISKEDTVGKKYSEVFYHSQKHHKDCFIAETMSNLKESSVEYYNQKIGRSYLMNTIPLFNEQNQLQYILQTMMDITEIKDRESKLKDSRLAFYNMLRDVDIAHKELQSLHDGLILALAKAVDAKSPWTKNHSELVAKYSVIIAKELGLSSKEVETLRVAAILHDIGKIGIYDSILYKPGKLTNDEYSLIKLHSDRGAEILGHIKQLEDIARVIKFHHERIDGFGYPEGLKGKDIPLYSRIIAVADAFEAMTSDRPYRPVLDRKLAVEELIRFSGTQFDEELVKAFINSIS